MPESPGAGNISPQTKVLCLVTLLLWCHIAGGDEDQWASAITSTSQLQPHLRGVPGGARCASSCSMLEEIGTFSISLIAWL